MNLHGKLEPVKAVVVVDGRPDLSSRSLNGNESTSVFATWSRTTGKLNAVVMVVAVEGRPSEPSNLTAE